jgi:hypothetical protein
MVWVHNKGQEFLVDHWDGKPYSFSPNKPIEVPDHVARHIFGYGLEDKVPVLARLGWTQTLVDVPKAMERLNKFVITSEKPQPYHATSPVVDQVPSLASRQGRGKDSK